MKDETEAVHDDFSFQSRPLMPPIFQTSAYALPEGVKYRYTRENNPTVEYLNNKIASLERTDKAASFSSGMGAITTVLLRHLRPGKRVLIHSDVFARTLHFLKNFLSEWNIQTTISGPGTDSLLQSYDGHDIVFVESISNPTLRVHDIERISHSIEEESLLIVDSTFATPVNVNPIKLGADVVIHSGSKFLSGHNDVIAGFAAGQSKVIEEIDQFRKTMGESLDPFAAYLTIRGIKTLSIRMRQSEASALKISDELLASGLVNHVFYPGLNDHPDYEITKRQMRGFGGVLSFSLKKKIQKQEELFASLKTIVSANTLGGTNTTISHPATMSHRSYSVEEMKNAGFDDGLYRLSVGLENWNDISEDLLSAIKRAVNAGD